MKTIDFEYFPRGNLDFEGSGGPFWSPFRAKMVTKSVFGKKSAQVTTKINISWLRDALGGARGRTKKTLEIPKRPPEEVLGHFSNKKELKWGTAGGGEGYHAARKEKSARENFSSSLGLVFVGDVRG